MVFKAKLGKEDVTVMIDSGANQNYANKQIGTKLDHYQRKKSMSYPLTMANGKTTDWIQDELYQVPFEIGNYNGKISLDITEIPKYDVVLGMAWLHDTNPVMDWKKRQLTFPSCSTEDKKEDRSPLKASIKAI